MKTGYTNSPVSNAQVDPSEQGFSITLGRFDICPFGTVIDTRTGASLGRIQYMRADTRNVTEQEVLRTWRAHLAANEPAHARRAA